RRSAPGARSAEQLQLAPPVRGRAGSGRSVSPDRAGGGDPDRVARGRADPGGGGGRPPPREPRPRGRPLRAGEAPHSGGRGVRDRHGERELLAPAGAARPAQARVARSRLTPPGAAAPSPRAPVGPGDPSASKRRPSLSRRAVGLVLT